VGISGEINLLSTSSDVIELQFDLQLNMNYVTMTLRFWLILDLWRSADFGRSTPCIYIIYNVYIFFYNYFFTVSQHCAGSLLLNILTFVFGFTAY
jgi:hypothetical protein